MSGIFDIGIFDVGIFDHAKFQEAAKDFANVLDAEVMVDLLAADSTPVRNNFLADGVAGTVFDTGIFDSGIFDSQIPIYANPPLSAEVRNPRNTVVLSYDRTSL